MNEIRSKGGEAEKFKADLSQPNGPHEPAEQVKKATSKLDILVANAGVSTAATIEDTKVEDFDRQFAVNVHAPFFLVQQLLPILSDASSVVLVSSLAARAAVGTLSAYASTKGAIDTLVKHFASALGERGIRVNAIAPGVVATDMSSFAKTDAGKDFTLSIQAIKRLAQPADIAGAVAFLASDDAQWVTGDTLRWTAVRSSDCGKSRRPSAAAGGRLLAYALPTEIWSIAASLADERAASGRSRGKPPGRLVARLLKTIIVAPAFPSLKDSSAFCGKSAKTDASGAEELVPGSVSAASGVAKTRPFCN
ncbi:SDR family NAD(P)-dependent oxidoreductase [Rhizobium leguminosarum]|uniref:SDR family NAD(P)-dependent oxidoreductase n=1 Tax=Rhizobium leguminosarum TaxID=384 RepID=UPI003F9E3344